MSLKHLMFYVGCAVTWFILLPLLMVGAGTALLVYALIAELGERFGRARTAAIEPSTAREIAQRMCLGH